MSIPKFIKGDSVRIRDWGAMYSGYFEMARRLGATKWRAEEFTSYDKRTKNKIGIVKNWAIDRLSIIYLIDLGMSELLIGEEGIEFCERKQPKEFGIVKFVRENYARV